MSEQATTPFSSRVEILSQLWIEYRSDSGFEMLLEYGDLGFPLAYAINGGIVESTPMAEQHINEIWEMFMASLDLEDTGFESLIQIFTERPLD